MSLKTYEEKRDFGSTPEPSGAQVAEAGPLWRFVVQKHAASRLHYDFRLEVDGVLKSWAIPKGPSLDPSIKRLALQVEDHPLDYREFEGIIPRGNYGAGEVIVWDEGYYAAVDAETLDDNRARIRRGLAKGDLKFVLEGRKLHGEFALVRTGGNVAASGNGWLLIKKKDQFATDDDITANARSVQSGMTIEELRERGSGRIWSSSSPPPSDPSPSTDPMPHNLSPMLAAPVKEPFDAPEWIYEIKFDGYRALAEIDNGAVKLYSRNGLPFNSRFPDIVESLQQFGGRSILDGELVILDERGRTSFQALQNFARTGDGTVVYWVFDLLYRDARDLRMLPLIERKDILRRLLESRDGSDGDIRYVDHIAERGRQFYEAAVYNGLEGIVAKRGSSSYSTGRRSRDWLKIKIQMRQEAVICGYTRPKGGRRYFGSLVLGAWEQGTLRYIGSSGGGFDEATLRDIHDRLQPLIVDDPPFAPPAGVPAGVTWVRPELVCEVSFTEWTGENVMRHPVYLGLREDKDAHQVTRESAGLEVREVLSGENDGERCDAEREASRFIPFTNRDKLFWPEEGITKGDVIEYYHRMADYILPYLKDRPESLYRTPDGITGQAFYQKDVGELPPDWVATSDIYSESNAKTLRYIICQDRDTLLYLANLGCIEINPWLSRLHHLEYPDYCVIDLDPEEIGFDRVIETALTVREVLDSAGITSYPKTSGATGLHIYIPLGARYHYDTSVTFARLITTIVNSRLPGFTSIERLPHKRRGKVYLDFLQNRMGQTLAAPYSIRPRPGATVSTPLDWKEVRPELDPRGFTIQTIQARLREKGDLFAGVLRDGVDIEECIRRMG